MVICPIGSDLTPVYGAFGKDKVKKMAEIGVIYLNYSKKLAASLAPMEVV